MQIRVCLKYFVNGCRLIQKCRNQWWGPLFFLDQKYPFWKNLVQKIKIVNLSCNLVPRLIQTCRIQWDVDFL